MNNHDDKIEALYQKYKRLMYREAYRILNDAALTEDAIQQSFMKVMANMHKIGEVDDNRTRNYLVIICRNTAIDMQKEKLYLNEDMNCIDYENDEETELIDFVEPSEIVISKETINRVTKAIGELPDIYRDVILLEKVYHYSKEEMATLLNVNYETIKKRSLRARKMLADVLEKEGYLKP